MVGDVELDEESHEVRRAGARVDLTPTEFRLLHYLMMNAGQVVSKAQIRDRVWDYSFDGKVNMVEVYVSYLRKKLDAHGPPLIRTVRGIGYSMRARPGPGVPARPRRAPGRRGSGGPPGRRPALRGRRHHEAALPVTLRLRLLLLLVGIVAAGLVISDVVTYNALRSFLTTRVDQQLEVAAFPVGRALLSSSGLGPPVPAAPPTGATGTGAGSTAPAAPVTTDPRSARAADRSPGRARSPTAAASSDPAAGPTGACWSRRAPTASCGAARAPSRPTSSSPTGASAHRPGHPAQAARQRACPRDGTTTSPPRAPAPGR